MKRRFWAGLLSFMMLWSLLPANALAADEENEEAELETEVSTSENSPVQVKKTINGDGTKLTLEAYAINEVTQTSSTKPLDIVLVLDQSGSMAYNFDGKDEGSPSERCQYAMKQAVNSFIEKATSADGTHNMAIVTFGTDVKVLNSGWTKVDTEGAKALTNAINRLSDKPTGATDVGAGMKKAQDLMKSDTNRQKVVIVFTDGVPTTTNEFDTAVANSAITAAKSMKDAGVTIYTVGIFNGANPAQLHGDKFDRVEDLFGIVKDDPCNGNVGEYWGYTNMNAWVAGGSIRGLDIAATNRFLNFLSSNFDAATEIGIREDTSHGLVGGQAWEITRNFNRTASDYYLTAQDSASLNNMFQQIIQEISKLEIKADEKAILSDTLSEYFALNVPEGTDAAKAITAEKWDYTVKDGSYTWKKADTQPAMTIEVTGKKINVTGFDYTKNAVTATTTKEGVTTYSGAKLIVTIPIKPDTTCKTWRAGKNAYVTNDTVTNKAGLSGYTDKEGKTSLETVLSDSPEAMVTAYTVTYEVTGEAPETAGYTDPRAYIKGQTADVLDAPKSPVEKDGFTYTFTGWQNDTAPAGKTIEIVDHDVVLTGTWSKVANEYTVTYVPYDEDSNHPNGPIQVPDSVKHKKDTEVTVADPLVSVRGTKDGKDGTWTFDGWKTADAVIENGKFKMPAKNVTLTGTWSFNADEPLVYTLTYKLNGGKVAEDAEYTKAGTYAAGAVIAAPNATDMSKEGDTFAGWYTDEGLNQPWTGTTMPASNLTLYARWNEIPVAQTGKVIITKRVVDTDGNDLIPTGEFTFNVKKGDEIVGGDSLRYDGTKLTNAVINNLEAGTYTLSEDLKKAMNAIPGYELVGVRFVETGKESEPDTQAATDDTATTAFGDYRFEIKTSDSAIFVTCINTYEKKEVEPDIYTVTYTDGANGSAFKDQVYSGLKSGVATPAFNGTPERDGYTFRGWDPAVEATVTKNVTYTATWTRNSSRDDDDDYYFAIQKVDAQDGHALNGATFELYQLDKNDKVVNRRVTKTRQHSSENGIALFSVDNKNSYDGIWYYAEVTAPEGYVLDSAEHKIKAKDFSDSLSTAVKNADTVQNYRGTTPDLLNDSDHFAYVIGYKDGNVRPYGLISRAETTTIFFRLLKDSVRDGNLLTSNTYTDVADDYWANTAISTMTGLGIVQGRSTTTFDPKAPITRAQFAAICARFDTGKSNGEQTFSDIQGHWAEKYIERAAELGWIKGFEDGTFRPDTYITRAQAMTMINRVLNRIPEENGDLLAGMNTWPDCNPGDWFYLAVQEATNSHDFKHKAGNYETWTGMNKDPDWTRYEN